MGGGGAYFGVTMCVCLSACPSVCMSGFVQKISSEPFSFIVYFYKLSMLVHYRWPGCHAKTLGCYLRGQGHSEGLHNQHMNVSAISSQLMILFQPNDG